MYMMSAALLRVSAYIFCRIYAETFVYLCRNVKHEGSLLVKQSFLQLDQIRLPQSLHGQGCECDFDRIKRQERDDALCEADSEGDAHQVYIPECTESVAGKNAQDHGTDQRPEGLGAGGDETDDASAEDVADDVAAGRTGDDVQAAVKPCEYRQTDTAEQDIDELRQGAVFEAQTACGQQDAEYGEIDRHAGRQRDRDPGADDHNGGENAADNKRISGCCFSFCVCVHFLVSLSGYMGCCGTELCAKAPQNHSNFTVYNLCAQSYTLRTVISPVDKVSIWRDLVPSRYSTTNPPFSSISMARARMPSERRLSGLPMARAMAGLKIRICCPRMKERAR